MSTDAKTPRAASGRGRLMTTLFAAQVCESTGHSIGMAVGSIMAAGIFRHEHVVGRAVGPLLVLGPLAATLLRRPALASLSTPQT